MNKGIKNSILCFGLILQIFVINVKAASHSHAHGENHDHEKSHHHEKHDNCADCHFLNHSKIDSTYASIQIVKIEIVFSIILNKTIHKTSRFIFQNYSANAPPSV